MLDAGIYVLVLDRNHQIPFDCFAEDCLVEPASYHGKNITGPFRITLKEVYVPNVHWSDFAKPESLHFHITCMEAIGIDLVKHLKMQKVGHFANGPSVGAYNSVFHRAVEDWLKHGGKTYHPDVYDNAAFRKALDAHKEATEERLVTIGGVRCRLRPLFARNALPVPELSDLLPEGEEMVECKLSEVLLAVAGGRHLLEWDMLKDYVVRVVDIWGHTPASLSAKTLATEMAWLQALRERYGDDVTAGARAVQAESPRYTIGPSGSLPSLWFVQLWERHHERTPDGPSRLQRSEHRDSAQSLPGLQASPV